MITQKGMTLVEAVSCLLVFSVLVGMSIPYWEKTKQKIDLRTEMSRIVVELNKARSVAIKRNGDVVFNYNEKGYMVFEDGQSGGGGLADGIFQIGEKVLGNVQFAGSLRINLSESTCAGQKLRFSGRPGIFGGSVTLQTSGGLKGKVVVNSVGRVRTEVL